jgi:hypothetical protein
LAGTLLIGFMIAGLAYILFGLIVAIRALQKRRDRLYAEKYKQFIEQKNRVLRNLGGDEISG